MRARTAGLEPRSCIAEGSLWEFGKTGPSSVSVTRRVFRESSVSGVGGFLHFSILRIGGFLQSSISRVEVPSREFTPRFRGLNFFTSRFRGLKSALLSSALDFGEWRVPSVLDFGGWRAPSVLDFEGWRVSVKPVTLRAGVCLPVAGQIGGMPATPCRAGRGGLWQLKASRYIPIRSPAGHSDPCWHGVGSGGQGLTRFQQVCRPLAAGRASSHGAGSAAAVLASSHGASCPSGILRCCCWH